MTHYGKRLACVATGDTVAQNTDLLATDFQQKWEDSRIRITIVVSAAIIVKLVGSDSTVVLLNNGSALVADAAFTQELTLDTTRTWNVQTTAGGGMTCNLLTVVEVAR